MIYNAQYNLLVRARDNGDLASLASVLGISRQTVRHQLEALDEGLACSLYSRLDSEAVVLSEVGLVYASACEKASRLFIDAELKAEKYKREHENTIVIGTISKSPDRAIRQKSPYRLRTRFFDTSAEVLDSRAIGREMDCALGLYDDAWLRHNRLRAVRLSDRNLAVAFSALSPLAGRKRLDIEDLYGNTLYIPYRGFTRKTDLLASDLADFHQKITLVCRSAVNSALVEKAASEGSFILVAADQDLSQFGLKVLPVDWSYRTSYGLIYPQKAPAKVEELVRLLEESCEQGLLK